MSMVGLQEQAIEIFQPLITTFSIQLLTAGVVLPFTFKHLFRQNLGLKFIFALTLCAGFLWVNLLVVQRDAPNNLFGFLGLTRADLGDSRKIENQVYN
jgi:hypothetical protein